VASSGYKHFTPQGAGVHARHLGENRRMAELAAKVGNGLSATAFTAAHTDAMLDAAARTYVKHRRGARFEDGILAVSKIYAWYAADFGGNAPGVIDHLKRYAQPCLATALERAGGIDGYAYDRSLNEAAGR